MLRVGTATPSLGTFLELVFGDYAVGFVRDSSCKCLELDSVLVRSNVAIWAESKQRPNRNS